MIQTELLVSISLFVKKARRAGEETRNKKHEKLPAGRKKGGFCCGLGFVWFEGEGVVCSQDFSSILPGERDA